VLVDETGVECRRPDGLVERVTWRDLRAVTIETNDTGPRGSDFFWILEGEESGCVIPMGTQGEAELLTRLQQLPNFDNQALIAASACAENRRFVCWTRPEA
jgi:hypothetical protein